MTDPVYTPVAAVADVPADTLKAVMLNGRSIVIVHHAGTLYAVENRCSHADQALDCGRVRWGWIACPAHGAKFDLATGEALSQPATDPIATFPVRVTGDMIEVAAPGSP